MGLDIITRSILARIFTTEFSISAGCWADAMPALKENLYLGRTSNTEFTWIYFQTKYSQLDITIFPLGPVFIVIAKNSFVAIHRAFSTALMPRANLELYTSRGISSQQPF